MGIINRSLDATQQRSAFAETFAGNVAGATLPLCIVPYPALLDSVSLSEMGTPSCVVRIDISRFIAGTGFTAITGVGASLLVRNVGLSGVQSVSLIAAGSTGLILQAGDVVCALPTGISSILGQCAVSVVLKKTQDKVSFFGNSS